VLRVFPGADVANDRTSVQPIWLAVTTERGIIWEGRQQALFSKYAEERALASAEIVAALTTLKEELGLSEGGP